MKNALNWFEIPAADFERAKTFYELVMGAAMPVNVMGGTRMAFFATEDRGVGGAVCTGQMYRPAADGCVIYLNANPDLTGPLSRVEEAGGKILMPKTRINDEVGYMAFFTDSEGNRVALHSMK